MAVSTQRRGGEAQALDLAWILKIVALRRQAGWPIKATAFTCCSMQAVMWVLVVLLPAQVISTYSLIRLGIRPLVSPVVTQQTASRQGIQVMISLLAPPLS